jgi:F-type H+-transporting ATPase subunit epsilon
MAFQCVIVTPEQQALDESVSQAIVPAWDGQIGILTGRAPLLMKLGVGSLRVDLAGGQSRTFFVNGGIGQMKGDKLTILTTEAIAADHIDAEAARAEYAEVEARVANDPKSREERTAQLRRARAKQDVAAAAKAH